MSSYKNLLQEYVVIEGYASPIYDTSATGPSHAPTFRSSVSIDGKGNWFGRESGSKREAEKNAAEVAYKALRDNRGKVRETKELSEEPEVVRGLISFSNLVQINTTLSFDQIKGRARVFLHDLTPEQLAKLLKFSVQCGFLQNVGAYSWGRTSICPYVTVSKDDLNVLMQNLSLLELAAQDAGKNGNDLLSEIRRICRVQALPVDYIWQPEDETDEFVDLIKCVAPYQKTRGQNEGNEQQPGGALSRDPDLGVKVHAKAILERIEAGDKSEVLPMVLLVLMYTCDREWVEYGVLNCMCRTIWPKLRSGDIQSVLQNIVGLKLAKQNEVGHDSYYKLEERGREFVGFYVKLISPKVEA